MTFLRIILAVCASAAVSLPVLAATSSGEPASLDAGRGAINLDQPQPIAVPEPGQIGNPLWAIPLGSLDKTRNRPLFTPSRRPPAPAVVFVPPSVVQPKVVVAPAAPEHPNLTLIGTVVGETEGIGVFLDRATNAFVRIKTGEGHAGWILRSIKAREVTLEKGGQSETLRLPAREDAGSGALPPGGNL